MSDQDSLVSSVCKEMQESLDLHEHHLKMVELQKSQQPSMISPSISELSFNQDDTQDISDLCSIITLLSDHEQFANKYKFRITEYLLDRQNFSYRISQLADETQEIVKKAGIAKAASGGGNILAGSLAVGGIILAPFTAGVSLGFTYAGIGGGIASGITGATTEIIKNKKIKKHNNEIKEMKDTFVQREEVLVKLFDDFKRLSEKIKQIKSSTLTKLLEKYQVAKAVSYGGYTLYTTHNVLNIVKMIGTDFHSATSTLATSVASPGLIMPGFNGIFGTTLVTAGSTTAKFLSSSLAVIGIGFGTWDLVAGINDTNRSEVADSLRAFNQDYNNQTEDLIDFFDGIRKMAKIEKEVREEKSLGPDLIELS